MFMMFLGEDPEEPSELEKFAYGLRNVDIFMFCQPLTLEVVEWNLTPAFGPYVIAEGESPEGYYFKVKVDRDDIEHLYREQVGEL